MTCGASQLIGPDGLPQAHFHYVNFPDGLPQAHFHYVNFPDGVRVTLAWNCILNRWDPIPALEVTPGHLALLQHVVNQLSCPTKKALGF